jgi:glutaredoxin
MPPDEPTNLQGLILIGSPQCAPCARASQWLKDNGVPFRKVSVAGDERLAKWVVAKTGQNTVPQFFYNGEWIRQGFDLVKQLVEGGQLPSGRAG